MKYTSTHLNLRPILNESQKKALHALAQRRPLPEFLADQRNFEGWMVDFVYTSAKIEGNTYNRLDTDNLIRLGITSGDKRFSDAVMIVNLRNAFEVAMAPDQSRMLNESFACDLHQLLMKDLLPTQQVGVVRQSGVKIGGTEYTPPDSPLVLKSEMKALFAANDLFDDPFERAIHLHCNLAYLQFFQDGNKRTARMMQTASLAQSGILPLFFKDTLIGQYQRAVVGYYETGDYSAYADFFVSNYTQVIAEMVGKTEGDLRREVAKEVGIPGF